MEHQRNELGDVVHLDEHGIEIGAGLGPLAGKIWRVGLMGSGSTTDNITRLTGALKTLLA